MPNNNPQGHNQYTTTTHKRDPGNGRSMQAKAASSATGAKRATDNKTGAKRAQKSSPKR